MNKKILIVAFSDNADHQDIAFGMLEALKSEDIWIVAPNKLKINIKKTGKVKQIDCPQRPGLCKKTFDLKALNKLIKWIKKNGFNVLYFESLHVWNLIIMIALRKNVQTYQMVFDVIPHEGDKQAKAVSLMNRAIGRLADYIVLCNKKYIDEMSKRYSISMSKILSVDMWRRFPEYSFPENTKKMLFFGRIHPYKGINNLIEIIDLCPEIEFIVAGPVAESERAYINLLKTKKNVNVVEGYIVGSELENIFKQADWVVLPYNSATISGVVIDAYRFSKPVIAFNVGAIAEQVKEGVSGYLIEAGNNKLFAKKIYEVNRMDRCFYEKMTRLAYDYGKEKYSSEQAEGRIRQLIGCDEKEV